jgi:heat-inducible transcriptional repressor
MIGTELSPREREVLKAVVTHYIATGEPISSRFITKLDGFAWSSATIRNVMLDLEEKGYLVQPHVSAGRVPSDAGFRFYIQELLQEGPGGANQLSQIRDNLTGEEYPRLLEAVPRLIASLSHQIGLIVAPHFGHIPLRSMDLIPVDEGRVLVVLVARSGNILNKLIATSTPFTRDELAQLSRYLTARYSGKTLVEVRRRLRQAPPEEGLEGRLLPAGLTLSEHLLDALDQDEDFLMEADLSREAPMHLLIRIRQNLRERARLLELLNSCIESTRTRVVLGEESPFTARHECAVVATRYSVGDLSMGAVGIIGPRAMPYHLVIPIVEETARQLTRKMTETGGNG